MAATVERHAGGGSEDGRTDVREQGRPATAHRQSRPDTLRACPLREISPGNSPHNQKLCAHEDLSDEYEKGYKHQTVNHAAGEYVNGNTHVNGMENFWMHLKGGIRGTHIHVSKKHLPKYAKEFEYRFNSRENPSAMFPALVSEFSKP